MSVFYLLIRYRVFFLKMVLFKGLIASLGSLASPFLNFMYIFNLYGKMIIK